MFITFSCDAYENITYFNDVAKQLLSLMGHSGAVPGALKADQVSAALSNLQKGLEMDQSRVSANKVDEEEDNEREISLSNRAVPLINLLKAAVKKDCDVLWATSRSPG